MPTNRFAQGKKTAANQLHLEGETYTGGFGNISSWAVGDEFPVGYLQPGTNRQPVIIGFPTNLLERKLLPPGALVPANHWLCPEGGTSITYAASGPQPPLSLTGPELWTETLERFVAGGGTFDYSTQQGYTDPTGLVRFGVGNQEFLAAVWARFTVASERRGHLAVRIRNLSSGAWLGAPLYLGRQIARMPGPVGFTLLPGRREGGLFYCPHPENAAKGFLFAVFPGSATKVTGDPGPTGGAFAVLPWDNLTAGAVYAFTSDNILDRDSGPDPDTGKIYRPVERSGSFAVAEMAALECYWTGWQENDGDGEPDYSNTDRAVLHFYKVDPATLALSNFNRSLRALLDGAFTGFSEILACGIMAPYDLLVQDSETEELSVLASGYQMQLSSTRWPYNPVRNSFQFQICLKLNQFGTKTPRALSAEIRLSDGEIALLGTPRAPENHIEEPYSGFVSEKAAELQAAIPAYVPGSYGYSYFDGGTGQPIIFKSFVTDACEYLEGFGDLENYPEQGQFYWHVTLSIANTPEQFWGGMNAAQIALAEAQSVGGEIITFPLPTVINGTANPYYEPSLLPCIDHAGKNYGLSPTGIVVDGKAIHCEARPQRVVTQVSYYSNNEGYTGTRPDGTEETKSFPTYDDWDPDHQLANWERYAECWVPIPSVIVKAHGTVAIEGQYQTIERYYRSYLVVTNGSAVTSYDISCRFKLTGTDPRFDSYSAAFNIFQWRAVGEVIFLLRLWPSDWTGPTKAYSDMSAVAAKLEPHLEVRSLANPTTVLSRRRLRPAADTGELWSPISNYPPHMLCNVSGGKPWAHVWTEWKGSGDSYPRHASAQCTWSGEELEVVESVTSPAAKPEGRPSLVESTVALVTDNQITWFDNCNSIRSKSIS